MHLLVSAHPGVFVSSCWCVLACILTSLHPHIFRFLCPCLHPCILISPGSCVLAYILASSLPIYSSSYVLACILASSYPQVNVCLLVSLHPHILRFMCACLYPRILISSGCCALVGILTSFLPHIFRFIYSCLHPYILRFLCACLYILASSYPQVYECLLVCSHLQVNVFSMRMNNCILASSSSLVLGNCASHFVNNLQILRTGQAFFVLDFYCTRRKIYRKQPLRADLKKKVVVKI